MATITSSVETVRTWWSILFGYLDEIKDLLDGTKEDYGDFEIGREGQTDADASGTINGAVNNVKGGFGFSNDITNSVNSMISAITDTSSAPSYSVYIDCWAYRGELKIIDLSWYSKYKSTGDTIICIFCYSAFLWHIFTRLPDIIQGGGAASYSISKFTGTDV